MKNSRLLKLILSQDRADDDTLSGAVEHLRRRGFRIDVYRFETPDDLRDLSRRALDSDPAVIVGAGGDGTLNAIATALIENQAIDRSGIGILPDGTANDFATACGIPTDDPVSALEIAATCALHSIDVGRVNDRVFVNAASGGFGAEVTATTPRGLKKTLGGFAYLVNGLIHVPNVEGKKARVTTPDFEWGGKLIGFTVANGRLAGGGFEVAPKASLNDRQLDVVLFPEVGEEGWTGLVSDLVMDRSRESDDDLEYLVSCRAPWIEIEVAEPLHLNVDGEPLKERKFRFDLLERQIQFALPIDCGLLDESDTKSGS